MRLERLGARVSGEDPRGRLGRTAYVLGRLPEVLRSSEARLYHALGNFNLPLVRTPGKAYVAHRSRLDSPADARDGVRGLPLAVPPVAGPECPGGGPHPLRERVHPG